MRRTNSPGFEAPLPVAVLVLLAEAGTLLDPLAVRRSRPPTAYDGVVAQDVLHLLGGFHDLGGGSSCQRRQTWPAAKRPRRHHVDLATWATTPSELTDTLDPSNFSVVTATGVVRDGRARVLGQEDAVNFGPLVYESSPDFADFANRRRIWQFCEFVAAFGRF